MQSSFGDFVRMNALANCGWWLYFFRQTLSWHNFSLLFVLVSVKKGFLKVQQWGPGWESGALLKGSLCVSCVRHIIWGGKGAEWLLPRLVWAPVRKLQELLSGWFSLVKSSQALIECAPSGIEDCQTSELLTISFGSALSFVLTVYTTRRLERVALAGAVPGWQQPSSAGTSRARRHIPSLSGMLDLQRRFRRSCKGR